MLLPALRRLARWPSRSRRTARRRPPRRPLCLEPLEPRWLPGAVSGPPLPQGAAGGSGPPPQAPPPAAPVLTTLHGGRVTTLVSGTLSGTPGTNYRIALLTGTLGPAGQVQNTQSFSQVSVTAGADGSAGFLTVVPAGLPSGQVLTATAIDPAGHTSALAAPLGVLARADQGTLDENTSITLNVLANDTNLGGSGLVVPRIFPPSQGTAVLNPDGTITFTPDEDFSGVVSFSYEVSDTDSDCPLTAAAPVVLTVVPVPRPPIANDDSAQTTQDTPVTLDVLANDIDRNPTPGVGLVPVVVEPPDHGTLTPNSDGTFTYTPNAGFTGTDSFVYQDQEGQLTSNPATVTIQVLPPVNLPPTANDDSARTDSNTPVTIAVLANDADPENDPLTPVLNDLPARGTATVNPDGTITYTPDGAFFGTDTFTYFDTDGTNTSNLATVTVQIAPAFNTPPVAVDDLATARLDTPVTIDVLANDFDPDGDPLQAFLNTPPANGTVEQNPDGMFTYTPNPGFVGTDTFTYIANDGFFEGTEATVTIQVLLPPAPVANTDYAYTLPDTPVFIDVLADDFFPSGNRVLPEVLQGPFHGSLTDHGDGTYTYTPDQGFIGPDFFEYELSDVGGSSSAFVYIAVSRPPVAQDDVATTNANTPVTIDVLANDSDPQGSPLTVYAYSGPSNGTLTQQSNGVYVYTPAPGFVGDDVFYYADYNTAGAYATATVTIHVLPANQPPVAADDSASTAQGQPVTIDVRSNDSDPDGDSFGVTAVGRPGHGTATLTEAGQVLYQPDAAFHGQDRFTYTITDAGGLSSTATVTVTVVAVDVPPVPAGDAYAVHSGQTLIVGQQAGLLVNDLNQDGDVLHTHVAAGPRHGVLQLNGDGTFTYTPQAGFVGTDRFAYAVMADDEPTCEFAMVTIAVLSPATPSSQSGPGSRTSVDETPQLAEAITHVAAALPAPGAQDAVFVGAQPLPLLDVSAHALPQNPVALPPQVAVLGGSATYGEIRGRVFLDAGGKGVADGQAAGLGGAVVYLDMNHNGVWDPGEPFTYADAKGEYVFRSLRLDKYEVRVLRWSFMQQTAPVEDGGHEVRLSPERQIVTDQDFGVILLRQRRRQPSGPAGPESRLPAPAPRQAAAPAQLLEEAPPPGADGAPAGEEEAAAPGLGAWFFSLLPLAALRGRRARRRHRVA